MDSNLPISFGKRSETDGVGSGDATQDLITKAELARRLHKTPRCIEIWMRRRYIPYLKVGRSVLFQWRDVVIALNRFRIS